MKKTALILFPAFLGLAFPAQLQAQEQQKATMDMQETLEAFGTGIKESLTSEETLNQLRQIKENLTKAVEDFQSLVSDAVAMLYVSDRENAALPPLTEADLPAVKAALPKQFRDSAVLLDEIPDAFDMESSADGVRLRITRHIGLNIAVAKLFAQRDKKMPDAAQEVETLSGGKIAIDKFKKEKIGAFNTIAARDESTSFFITNAGAFLAVRIESQDAAKAKKVLAQLSESALMKAFKTDQMKLTVKDALNEVEKVKNDPDFNTKMYEYMQRSAKAEPSGS